MCAKGTKYIDCGGGFHVQSVENSGIESVYFAEAGRC